MINPEIWCPEAFKSMYIERYNDNSVKIAPCCQAVSVIRDIHDMDFNRDEHLGNIRSDMLQGLKSPACDRCWRDEALGQKSRRQSASEFFGLEPTDVIQLESLDYNATWACNLACVMCGPFYSSTWAAELQMSSDYLRKLGRKFYRSNAVLDDIDFSRLEKIHFNGGEPLINNEHQQVLRRLEHSGRLSQVMLSYNTNGTQLPGPDVLELWSRARLVKIFFSIDATEKAFEYIRHPASWDQVRHTVDTIKHLVPGNVMFGINVTVGSYNLLEIPHVLDWFDSHLKSNLSQDASDFCLQFADNFPIKSLPRAVLEVAIRRMRGIDRLQGLVAIAQQSLTERDNNEWQCRLDEIDNRRGTSWKDSLEIAKILGTQQC